MIINWLNLEKCRDALKLDIEPQFLSKNGLDNCIETLRLDFTEINDRHPKKIHSVIISILDSSKNEDKFKLLATEPHVDFTIEAHQALKEGDLAQFAELTRNDYRKLYML